MSKLVLTIVLALYGFVNFSGIDAASILSEDTKVQILKYPRPESSRCSQSKGIAILIVTFDKSAKITNVEIFKSSGCDGFDTNATKAAKGIVFKPATKNGEPITVKKQCEYSFERY